MGSGINNKIDEFLCNPKDVKKRRNKKPAAQRTPSTAVGTVVAPPSIWRHFLSEVAPSAF